MQRLSLRIALAAGFHLSSLSGYKGLANQTQSVGLWRLRLPGIDDGWNHLSRHPQAAGYVVSGYLVCNQSKDRRQRDEFAKTAWSWQLLHGMDLAP